MTSLQWLDIIRFDVQSVHSFYLVVQPIILVSEQSILLFKVVDFVLFLSLLMIGLLYIVRHLFHQCFELPALVIDRLGGAVAWSDGFNVANLLNLWLWCISPCLLRLLHVFSNSRLVQIISWRFTR